MKRAVLDPLADHVDRRRLKGGPPASGHWLADCLRAVELLDEEARVGIEWDHADQVRVLPAGDTDQVAQQARPEPDPRGPIRSRREPPHPEARRHANSRRANARWRAGPP